MIPTKRGLFHRVRLRHRDWHLFYFGLSLVVIHSRFRNRHIYWLGLRFIFQAYGRVFRPGLPMRPDVA